MIWFISDAHFGHRNIHLMGGRPIDGPVDNENWICDYWQDNVSRKVAVDRADVVYCLGDMAFDEASLRIINSLNGMKVLVKGNHDHSSPFESIVYRAVLGLHKRYNVWLSHCPIHEQELRGKPNVHGHVHSSTVPDPRYFNICPENLFARFGKPMISLDELRNWIKEYESPLHT